MKQTQLEKSIIDLVQEHSNKSKRSIHTIFRMATKCNNYDHITNVMLGKRTMTANGFGRLKEKAYEYLSNDRDWLEKKIKQSEAKTEWLRRKLEELV